MILNFILIALLLLLVSYLLNRTILRFVKTLGIRGKNNISVRWNKVTKPSLGGINFYIIFLISIVLFSFMNEDSNLIANSTTTGLFISGTIAFILGLADDAYNTNPFIKLTSQVTCGILFVITGNQINFFNSVELDTILTLFWVIGMMNSINMLDNMDGISTITVIGILGACLIVDLFTREPNFNTFILLAMIATLIGFLYYNFYPSKMFMGDTGSQFLGVIISYFGIQYAWQAPITLVDWTIPVYWFQIIMVMIIFALPMMDTFTVTYNRLYKGRSPMVGGKDHTTHYLSRSGLGDAKVGYFFILFSIIQLVSVLLICSISIVSDIFLTGIIFCYFVGLLVFGLTITRKERKLND